VTARAAAFPGAARAIDVARPGLLDVERLEVVVGAVAGVGYVGLLWLSAGPLMLAVLAMVAVAIVSPVAGLATLAVILPIPEPDLLIPIRVVGAVVGATAFGTLLRTAMRPAPIRISPGTLIALGYLALSGLSVIPAVSGYPAEWEKSAALSFIHLATGIAIVILASHLLRDRSSAPIVALAVASACVVAAIGIADFVHLGGATGGFAQLLPASDETRSSGVFSNSNYQGFFLAQAAILALAIATAGRGLAALLSGFALIVIGVGLAATLSRGGFLGLAAGVVIAAWIRSPRFAIALVVMLAAAVAIVYPIFLAARLDLTAGSTDLAAYLGQARSEFERTTAFEAGLRLFQSAPIFGVGFGVFEFTSSQYLTFSFATFSHDQWLDILAEQGLVGIGLVLTALAGLASALSRSEHRLASGARAMLGAYLVASFFIDSATSIQISGLTWLILGIVLSRRPFPALEGAT
jgi:O-antigen ligase